MAEIIGSELTETLEGTAGADTIISNGGADTMLGLGGDDEFVLNDMLFDVSNRFAPRFPAYDIDGGEGTDTLVFRNSAVQQNLFTTVTPEGELHTRHYLATSTIASIEELKFESDAGTTVLAIFSMANDGVMVNQLDAGAHSPSATLVGGAGTDGAGFTASYFNEPNQVILDAPSFTYVNWASSQRAYDNGDNVFVALIAPNGVLNGTPHSGIQALTFIGVDGTINGSDDMDRITAFSFGSSSPNQQFNLFGNGGDDTFVFVNDIQVLTGPTGDVISQVPNTKFWFGTQVDGGSGFDFLMFGGPVLFQATVVNVEGVFLSPAYTGEAQPDSSFTNQELTVVTMREDQFLSGMPSDLLFDGEGTFIIEITGPSFDASQFRFDPGSTVVIGIEGTYGADTIVGSSGADVIGGGGGDDVIDGGDGIDTVVFEYFIEDYSIAVQGGTITVTGPNEGTDTLTNIEFLTFGDEVFAASEVDNVVRLNAVSFSPADGAVDVALDSNIVITFDAPIERGNGTIFLDGFGAASEFFDVATSDRVTISGYTLTIDPVITMQDDWNYVIRIDRGAIVSLTGHIYIGTQEFDFTTVDVNQPPYVYPPNVQFRLKEDQSITAYIPASDDDGDPIFFSVKPGAEPALGKVTFNDHHFFYTPDDNLYGADSFTIIISDNRGGTAEQTVSLVIEAVNDAPVTAPTQAVSGIAGTSLQFSVLASDAEGDPLIFVAAKAANGTISGGGGGVFTYMPDFGFAGTDSFEVTVNDPFGGFARQTVNITVRDPVFSAFLADGFAGGISGDGTVFGSNGFQDVNVPAGSGRVDLDPSFNRGGDVIRLEGDAIGYDAERVGSSVVLDNGISTISIPVGSAGVSLVFGDGVRTLRFEASDQTIRIGDQVINGSGNPVTAPAEAVTVPDNADPSAIALAFLDPTSEVIVTGNFQVFGTASSEQVHYLAGDVLLDPSFNRGGDTLIVDDAADAFTAWRAGSSLVLIGADGTITIPVGSAGMTIDFGGDMRTLRYEAASDSIMVGDQAITARDAGSAETLNTLLDQFMVLEAGSGMGAIA